MENELANMALVVASAPIISLFIQYAIKPLGLAVKYTGLAAVALGLTFAFIKNPSIAPADLLSNLATGVVAAASAAGVYSQYKVITKDIGK